MLFLSALCLVAACAPSSGPPAASAPRASVEWHRLRSTSERLLEAIREGTRKSPTFRAVVEDIESRDVVVYLLPGNCTTATARSCMTFLTRAGGIRYVLVRMSMRQSQPDLIAHVAHELTHAFEVADAPHVVDERTFRTFYEQRNYATCGRACGYETETAVATQRAVRHQLARSRAGTASQIARRRP